MSEITAKLKFIQDTLKRLTGKNVSHNEIKDNYLKFLPYTWTLIEKRLQNPALKNLKLLFYKHLSIKKLKKIK